jgi:topoisomerase IV subunit A
MMKSAAVKGLTRDKEYNITKGTKNSRIIYFSANPNGEAEVVKGLPQTKAQIEKPGV